MTYAFMEKVSSELVDLVCSAIRKASDAILKVYDSDQFQSELKSDLSPLTIADKNSHDILCKELQSTGFPVLSEEDAGVSYHERKSWPLYWLVDPLDGTKEFLKKNGEFTVNVALMKNSVPVFGAIGIPVDGTIYFGPFENKVLCQEKDGSSRNLKPSQPLDLNRSGIRVVASRSHLDERTSKMIAGLNEPVLVSKGSSLKFLLLADGKADFYPRFAPTMEWDTAAADAILRPLNIQIIETESKKSLQYNKEDLRNPFFICRPV